MPGNRRCRSASTSSAAGRSCRSAGRTLASSSRPCVSTTRWRLRPFTFLPPSWPRGPPISVVSTDWLSMTEALGWGGAADLFAHALAQGGVDRLPQAARAPPAEVVEGRLPGREAVRQHPPRHPAAQDVEDGVEDLAQSGRAGTPSGLPGRKQRLEDGEFRFGQITVIMLAVHSAYICITYSQTSS